MEALFIFAGTDCSEISQSVLYTSVCSFVYSTVSAAFMKVTCTFAEKNLMVIKSAKGHPRGLSISIELGGSWGYSAPLQSQPFVEIHPRSWVSLITRSWHWSWMLSRRFMLICISAIKRIFVILIFKSQSAAPQKNGHYPVLSWPF